MKTIQNMNTELSKELESLTKIQPEIKQHGKLRNPNELRGKLHRLKDMREFQILKTR